MWTAPPHAVRLRRSRAWPLALVAAFGAGVIGSTLVATPPSFVPSASFPIPETWRALCVGLGLVLLVAPVAHLVATLRGRPALLVDAEGVHDRSTSLGGLLIPWSKLCGSALVPVARGEFTIELRVADRTWYAEALSPAARLSWRLTTRLRFWVHAHDGPFVEHEVAGDLLELTAAEARELTTRIDEAARSRPR